MISMLVCSDLVAVVYAKELHGVHVMVVLFRWYVCIFNSELRKDRATAAGTADVAAAGVGCHGTSSVDSRGASSSAMGPSSAGARCATSNLSSMFQASGCRCEMPTVV